MNGNRWDYFTGEDNSYEAFKHWEETLDGDEYEDEDEDEIQEDTL